MAKCTGFERSAHQTKIHHLQPGDMVSPRRVVKALTHEQILTPRRVEDAIKAANVAIERRESLEMIEASNWRRFLRWIKG